MSEDNLNPVSLTQRLRSSSRGTASSRDRRPAQRFSDTKSRIFLSYASEDHEAARCLARALGQGGRSVWWDREVLPGEIIEDSIQEALDSAVCVVVLWSRHSVRSHWVKDEAKQANERGVLVPVLLEDVRLPLGYGGIRTGRLSDWAGEANHKGFQRLTRAIDQHLGRQSPQLPAGKS